MLIAVALKLVEAWDKMPNIFSHKTMLTCHHKHSHVINLHMSCMHMRMYDMKNHVHSIKRRETTPPPPFISPPNHMCELLFCEKMFDISNRDRE